jgi:hypothetical protein
LGVSQNESVHPKLESQPGQDENPESKQALEQSGRGAGAVGYGVVVGGVVMITPAVRSLL